MRSRTIEIHSKDRGLPFYVHETLLREASGLYGAMIDHVLKTTGKAAMRLNLSHGALAIWTMWLYGTPMVDDANPDIEHLEPLLELYEYSHHRTRPEADHKCANACLDAICTILDDQFDEFQFTNIFGHGNVPTFVDIITRLHACNGLGPQMVVDLMAHGERDAEAVYKTILNIEPVPSLAIFFHRLSYAMARECASETNMRGKEPGEPVEHISLPDPTEEPHRYHTHRAGEALCCGRQAENDK